MIHDKKKDTLYYYVIMRIIIVHDHAFLMYFKSFKIWRKTLIIQALVIMLLNQSWIFYTQ